ncbi:putative aldouronate transport system permease protein [Butyrivibrio sp. ob235]|uniref:ABC transporter permease n=1 Tax=Butyrivibrio sp. ob235 TaxID=1761780 RepID=UPI0008D8B710|nr:ABC transporter permease subunit [Butyrivibrio sp. ob235]SEL20879.1 putative aldouronate transport system permease protein [Butyrivibrio sp. ob235]
MVNRKKRKDTKDLLLMALPAIIWFLLFSYLPLFGVAFAFKQFTPVPGQSLFRNLFINSRFVGLKNFSFLLRSSDMPKIIFNTLSYNIIFLILGIALPVILAICLTELHNKVFVGYVQMVTVLPYFLSFVVVSYCVYGFLATDEGQLNHVLRLLGLSSVQWYQSPQYWRFILIITELWKSTGYSMIIYLCSITAIDRSLYESASLDGATFMDRAKYITLPLLQPTIATILILRTGSLLASDFGLFYQVPLDSNSLQPVTQTLDVYVYKALMKQANFSFSSAAAFLQSAVGCILLILTNTIIKKIDEDSSLG